MASQQARGQPVLRERRPGRDRVTFTELFFDLVYVFAVTQLSHLLLSHLSWRGALQTGLLLLAVWWAWTYTAWLTNWFDPDQQLVRLVLIATMLASLFMSATLPEAFGTRGLAFAAAYVAMQVIRSTFAILALRANPQLRRNFERILAWQAAAGAIWLAGGAALSGIREAVWVVAVGIDYTAPVCGFFVPGLGRSRTTDWTIAGGHLAERCQLFVIIALGESILVTGATFAGLTPGPAMIAAFVTAFLGSVALWWVYFDRSAHDGSHVIDSSADPGRLGRSAYTYFHLPMVAGIIVSAVADELVIAQPSSPATPATAAVILGSPALFLAGHALFKRAVFRAFPASRLTALVALAALAAVSPFVPALALAIAALLAVAAVAVADSITHRGRHDSQ